MPAAPSTARAARIPRHSPDCSRQRWSLAEAVIEAKRRSSQGVARGLTNVGEHVHPVDVLGLADFGCAWTESF